MPSPYTYLPSKPLPQQPALSFTQWCRALVRAFFFCTWLLLCMSVLFTGFLLDKICPGTVDAFRQRIPSFWARGVLRILGVRVQVTGELPKDPALWVSNHLSYLDPLIFMSLRPLFVLAKSEVRHWPGIGFGGQLAGTLFIERDRLRDLLRVIPEMQRLLLQGHSVLFFPEGTSTHGGLLLPFRSSLFEAAVRSGASVRCATLHLSTQSPDRPAWESVCWWGNMPFTGHVLRLMALRHGVDVCVRFSEVALLSESTRKPLARQARAQTATLFTPHPGTPAE